MRKKTLILDLDETLVHSTTSSQPPSDFQIEVYQKETQQTIIYFVHKRPFLSEFLLKINEWYRIVVYTASIAEYADQVLDLIDTKRIIKKRLFRDSCSITTRGFSKDLSLVEKDIRNVILLDNSLCCFELFPLNGILISSFYTNKSDTQLLEILPLLDALRFVNDVRSLLKLRNNAQDYKYSILP